MIGRFRLSEVTHLKAGRRLMQDGGDKARRDRLVKAVTADETAANSASKESLSSLLPDHIIGFILVSEPEDEELDREEVKFLFISSP